MSDLTRLMTTSIAVHPELWKEFQEAAATQHLTGSALLRQLIAKELKRAKREAAAQSKVVRHAK